MIKYRKKGSFSKIWNWFKAIGSCVGKIKEKNSSADLSFWGGEMSHIGAEVSRIQ